MQKQVVLCFKTCTYIIFYIEVLKMFLSVFYNAKSNIKGGRDYPEINGNVYFDKTKNGVVMTAKISGLPQSENNCTGRFFGFHIHERIFLYWKC